MPRIIPIGAMLFVWSGTLLAQEVPLIEEIVVSAQRVEESAQKVPVSVSAFSDAMLDERQIIGILDVQLNMPNMTATDTNFGPTELSIRGVGRLVEALGAGGSAVDAVSYHVNQVPLRGAPLNEFYDLERLEILRGPQGTLFGRNSTAGAVNATTKRPEFDGLQGSLQLDAGNYDLFRVKAAVEANFGDRFGIRVAGVKLDRDGYIENLADGQIPSVDSDLDGRNVYSFRITPEVRITDNTTIWLMYERTVEDDDRVRISNQVCKTNPLPTTACVPDEFGLEPIHPSATSWGVYAGVNGLIPLGARDASTGLNFDFSRPDLGLREQHTDFEPVFESEFDLLIVALEHAFASADLSILGSYSRLDFLSLQDRFMDVGYTLNPTAFNPSGLWPTPLPPRDKAWDPFTGPCDLLAGEAGLHGGCVADADQTRFFTYDQIGLKVEAWTAEATLATRFEGPLNGLLGGQFTRSPSEGAAYTPSNVFGSISIFGDPSMGPIGPPLYIGFDGGAGESRLTSYSVFGEVYWEPIERLKITGGLRYTDDEIRARSMSLQFQSFDARLPFGLAGDSPRWFRIDLLSWVLDPEPSEQALAITDHYGVTDAARAATDIDSLTAVLESVPPVAPIGEAQEVFGLPDTYSTDRLTGRLAVDWLMTPDVMLYGIYSTGFNPGGLSFFGGTFEDEKVNAFEAGAKTLLFDGSLLLNAAAFFNGYDGLHIEQRSANLNSIVENVDANVWGFEFESRWRPSQNWQVDVSYGWLDSEIDDFESLDIIDLTQGDPGLVLLRDLNGSANNYVAPRAEVLEVTQPAIAAGAALPAPGTVYPDGIPTYFSSAYLLANNVPAFGGVAANLNGNKLPNAPEHSLHIGVSYTWYLNFGSLTARWDYHWQDDMYARVFNRVGDEIESWDQHNASLSLMSSDSRWSIKAWIRNIEDSENITDHYLHGAEAAGPYRNYFLTEPRVYGATFRYDFGASL